jgi:hypothetical protein
MEVDGADGFRARVTQTPDLLHPESDTTTVATVAAACDLVRAFLDAFVAGTADPDPGPGDAAVTDR